MVEPGGVRHCARCGRAALTVVHAWQKRFAGIDTQTQILELACQSCGTQVVLHPEATIRAERLLGYLLLPAIIPGILFLARARKKARAWSDNPLVEEAGRPAESAPTGLPQRRCACTGAADCVAIVRKGTWERPIGMRYDYRCARCGDRFKVHDVGGVVFAGLLAAALSAAGALVMLHPPGTAVGADQSNRWFGVGMAVLGAVAWLVFASRIRGRLLHPVVGPNERLSAPR
jgi:DNA-directed RNA polymerase subunit RPC12/RpoP